MKVWEDFVGIRRTSLESGELPWKQEDFFESRIFLNPKRGLLEKRSESVASKHFAC